MIVSWNWLKDYVSLEMPPEEMSRRLMMAGLNLERTEEVEDDLAIDLEVTSNRPDCLGHVGVAREVAVLFGCPLTIPPAMPIANGPPVAGLLTVRIDCLELCPRYTARVVKGVKIRPSPRWLARRLEAVGISAINNVVDVSNYVMMECGQPLHTFDFAKLKGQQIIVRRARPGEALRAIDHKTYTLDPEICAIADAHEAVALAGVMGGAATEISPRTSSLLIEAAEFDPVSIRTTARRLNLHSDSSYRFERRVDPEGVDWASRRCCELILDLAGGELAEGVIEVGAAAPARSPIVLHYAELKRILGIEIDPARVRAILAALGNAEKEADSRSVSVVPPSWRRDLSREIDLVEEVARVHGYEQIPEDVRVAMAPSIRSREDRVAGKVRQVLAAAGFDEAMTLSAVDAATVASFSPWTDAPPLISLTPVLRGANHLRRSLVPSLLAARRTNESLANPEIELFEIAKVYLSRPGQLPLEEPMLALTSGRDLPAVKGVLEGLLGALNPAVSLEAADAGLQLLAPEASAKLLWGGQLLGYLGSLPPEGLKRFDLRGPTVVAELRMALLVETASLVPRYEPLSPFPAVSRDLNLVVAEAVRWADVACTVRRASGEYFESLDYCDTYRDPQRLGEGKKSLLMRLTLRSKKATLTNQAADAIRDQIVAACREAHAAELRM